MRKIGLALSVLLTVAGGAQAQLAITDKAILRTGKLKLDIHYPQTGRADIDRIFAERARAYAADGELNNTSEGSQSGSMSYEIKRNDAQMLSVQVRTYSYYAGHAHGMPDMVSYNFLMPDSAPVFLPELVDGRRGLERISQLVIADLTRQLGTSDLNSIQNGASPNAQSFSNFAWLPDALELTFIPYQVATYAAGTRIVRIPLSELADVIRPDPRAPAPSFSCTAARSSIEKTICSDAALARQDRQLAELYSDMLMFTSGRDGGHGESLDYRSAMQTKYEAMVASQRAWLIHRDKECAGGDKACLVRVYKDRRADLHRSPF
jgi:uncharacterized protein YecT (DUF1311 family)